MVLLDVVYNHFGPEGNYLHAYAPQFFNRRHHTPWGAAINFDGADSRTVRDFFIHNALYWLEEFHLDGLRLDAVHAIVDDSRAAHPGRARAQRVRARPGRERHVHLVLENDRNRARYLRARPRRPPRSPTRNGTTTCTMRCTCSLTGETRRLLRRLRRRAARAARPLRSPRASPTRASPRAYRGGEARGEPSAHLPPRAFVAFLQNHDQVGNRAFGERIAALARRRARCARRSRACCSRRRSPLLFMGEEFGARTPFLFFCDFAAELAAAVTRGRREEFAALRAFPRPRGARRIPDPNDERTFRASALDWTQVEASRIASWLALYRGPAGAAPRRVVPRSGAARHTPAQSAGATASLLRVDWALGDGRESRTSRANFGRTERRRSLPGGAPCSHLQRVADARGTLPGMAARGRGRHAGKHPA